MTLVSATPGVCGYFATVSGFCGATEDVRRYVVGWRCPPHTPAALAGKREPGARRYCPPAICWCGQCPGAPGRLIQTED